MKDKLVLITEKEAESLLNENNHLSNNEDLICELFNVNKVDSEDSIKGFGIEHTITNWYDNNSFISLSGEPYMFILYNNYWLPYIEYILIKELIDKYTNKRLCNIDDYVEVTNLKFGYVGETFKYKNINSGSNFQRYSIWITVNIIKNKKYEIKSNIRY